MTTTEQVLNRSLSMSGVWVDTYSPGDGVTRYRFILATDPATRHGGGYFATDGLYTALGRKEAMTYAAGLIDGRRITLDGMQRGTDNYGAPIYYGEA